MLLPSVHGLRLPLPTPGLKTRENDTIYVLSFSPYCASLFVMSQDEIALVDHWYAMPHETTKSFLQSMERQAADALLHLDTTVYLAAKQSLRHRFEVLSRIPIARNVSLDRYFTPSEKRQLHRCMLARMKQDRPYATLGSSPHRKN